MSIETLSAKPETTYQNIAPVKSVSAVEKSSVAGSNQMIQTENTSVTANNELDFTDGNFSKFDKNSKEQPSEADIKTASKDINKMINKNTVAEFGYHEATHRITIKIKDKNTNEVIKEIPSEKALEMLEKAWELAGIMVDEKR